MGKSSSKSAPAARAAAPVSVGTSTVTASAQQPNASDGKGPDLPRDALVLDWDPQNLGAEAAFDAEHGVGNDPTTDTQTGKRGKKAAAREVGSATVEDTEEDMDWEQARHDRRFPSDDDDAETVAAGAGDAGDAEKPAPTAEDRKSRADKRDAVLKALARQKNNLGAENAAREARAAAEAATKRATETEAKLAKATGGTLAERLAFIGLSKKELADAVILNGGELEEAAKAHGASDPEVAQLKADLAAMKARLTKFDEAEQNRNQAKVQADIAESRAKTAELVKDEPVVLVKSMKAYDRVLSGAWEAWKASGKKGAVADYVPAAAEVIEEQLETEYPDLAALKKGKATAKDDDEATVSGRGDRKVSRPAVGRRTGPSRVANRRDSLAGVIDGHERDRIIAKEMGWTT